MNIKPGIYLNGKHVDEMTKEEVVKIAFDALRKLSEIREAFYSIDECLKEGSDDYSR